ncbi:F0F1 ATP synthase subunit epsilon [uncultured Mailhella sp.]|uniref:F0F1 ATP synthase subunit epsilon n=1 Tax=uncultured Mailhella sp. TaxID=1981031 RepID=UPI00260E1ACC|nr:F0F1 ATP synthase subunit epsilon [uncultured Mailhella sp.]
MATLRLDIVTPDRVVLGADVDYVGAAGVDGQFGVLPDHSPLLSALKIGDLYYRQGGEVKWAFVSGGFAEVSENKVTVLAEAAELAADIDVDRAEQAKARAEKRLKAPEPDTDTARAELALTRAIARLRVAAHR